LSQSFDIPDLALDTAQRETEEFLTVQTAPTLSAVAYLVSAFGGDLLMTIQLNVRRFYLRSETITRMETNRPSKSRIGR
jgi:hypothetical protein